MLTGQYKWPYMQLHLCSTVTVCIERTDNVLDNFDPSDRTSKPFHRINLQWNDLTS